MKRFLFALALCGTLPTVALATPTENFNLRVLPAPGKVQVDGKIADWDLSGGIFSSNDAENQREDLAVWTHAMYDQDNLYLLARFMDKTPMNNRGQHVADYGFSGDSLQFRVITNMDTPNERVSHWTCWRDRDGIDVMDVAYGRKFDELKLRDAQEHGAQQVFSALPEGNGYIQEMAIPWKLLFKDGMPLPTVGTSFAMTIEPNFSVGIKGRSSLKDIFRSNVLLDRVFTFRAYRQWGPATLEKSGKVAPQPVRLADGREFPVTMKNGLPDINWTGLIRTVELPGFKTVAFEMPQDGYISLNIRSADGQVVRQLLNKAFYPKGKHQVKWDGLTNVNAKQPGTPVAAGKYTYDALFHTGIGVKLRGWAANSGNAPWDNGPTTNWGGDHGNPSATASDGKYVYLGWSAAEAGKSLLAVDLNGNVKWNNKRGGIAGVKSVASDGESVYVLGGLTGPANQGGSLYKLKAADGSYLQWTGSPEADFVVKNIWPADAPGPEKADAIAAQGGKLYLAFKEANLVAAIDGASGKLLGKWSVPSPAKLAMGGANQVLAVSGTTAIIQLDTASGQTKPLVEGLAEAYAVTQDSAGNLYVGLRDPDNQVRVYDATGKFLRTMGRKGGRNLLGKWTPDGFRSIASMSVAADGKLWVAENDEWPRRVSSWDTASGNVVKEFFGPTSYGAMGGAISPLDPNVMVGLGCEWALDPATGRATCVGVITREGMENARFAVGSNGRQYLAVAPGWTKDLPRVPIYERVGPGEYKLRAAFNYLDNDPKTKRPTRTEYWADANGDEQVQPNEVQSAPGNMRFSNWYMNLAPDLSLSYDQSVLRPTGFTAAGAPLYDISKPIATPDPQLGKTAPYGGGLVSVGGKTLVYNGAYGLDRSEFKAYDVSTGKFLWSYPNNFVGVHGSHKATPPEPGMVRGAYGFTGTASLPQPIGNIWVIGTNVGEWHILTEKGFYLTSLFQSNPLKVSWPDAAVPGADLSNAPSGMGGEDFGGSIAYGKDGKLYLQTGKTGFWNVEVTGLDSVRALPGGSLDMSPADVGEAGKLRETLLQDVVGKRLLLVKKGTREFTGNINSDFKGADFLSFSKSEDSAVRLATSWDENNLYVGWEVKDATPWVNAAGKPEEMYVSGDTVDLQLSTDPNADPKRREAGAGDLRLSIGNLGGTPTAMIYRAVSATKKPMVFSSGVIKEYKMDYVSTVPEATIKVTKRKDQYTVEAAIPLSVLGLKPEAATLRGDFGVTHGDPGGTRTRLRTYWNNQKTGIVDDAVFELKMEPGNWGEIQLAP